MPWQWVDDPEPVELAPWTCAQLLAIGAVVIVAVGLAIIGGVELWPR